MKRYKIEDGVLLLSCSQIESTLCFLDGILRHHLPDIRSYKMVLGTKEDVYESQYPADVLSQLEIFITNKKIKYIFISLIEYSLERAKALLQELKQKVDCTVIAGRPYCIEYPEKALDELSIDVVCYTHGLFLGEILTSKELQKVPNILFKDVFGTTIKTPPKNISYKMDDMPLANWSLDNLYSLYDPFWFGYSDKREPKIISLAGKTNTLPVHHHQVPAPNTGVLLVSIGCPVNTCKFCSISRMYEKNIELNKEEFGDISKKSGLRKVSFYSTDRIISTLKEHVKHRPGVNYILFNDNDFAALPPSQLTDFCGEYKKQINMPFYCQSSPHLTLSQGRKFLESLVDAGLDTYCMGVQTTAGINREVYDRTGSDKFIRKAINLVSEFVRDSGIYMALDFINGNPAESRQELIDTVNFIASIPLPWDLCIHNLTLSEDTDLYKELNTHSPKKYSKEHLEVEKSDYHNAQFYDFLSLSEPYLNIVLQFLDGYHNKEYCGRIKRKLVDLVEQDGFKELFTEEPELTKLFHELKDVRAESLEFLTQKSVIDFFNAHVNKLSQVFSKLQPTRYGYHREGRLDIVSDYA